MYVISFYTFLFGLIKPMSVIKVVKSRINMFLITGKHSKYFVM